MDISKAWTGKAADYVSETGDFGTVPHSDLAIHTGIAGKTIKRFALWFKDRALNWVHVQTDESYVDGLPGELMPHCLRVQFDKP